MLFTGCLRHGYHEFGGKEDLTMRLRGVLQPQQDRAAKKIRELELLATGQDQHQSLMRSLQSSAPNSGSEGYSSSGSLTSGIGTAADLAEAKHLMSLATQPGVIAHLEEFVNEAQARRNNGGVGRNGSSCRVSFSRERVVHLGTLFLPRQLMFRTGMRLRSVCGQL